MRKETYEAKMLRVHLSEKDRWKGKPLYEEIVSLCVNTGMAGATVYRGVEGFGQSGKIHSPGLWSGSGELPIVISVIDREEQVAKLLPHLEEMLPGGIVVMSDVELVQYIRE